jgi:hypothetical protein
MALGDMGNEKITYQKMENEYRELDSQLKIYLSRQ